ncbi:MAG TPA: Asp-tRNA(Asn)/Glu-tRNA(Gln) amidotransferase subunit GatB [Candidatus Brocadiia bacterium]|nr:Asp-tRNA(Asn)/Glu-tRNA(Gln) amidotransferase subunit GatB [Candidatus Brocadiia bacterium]
MEWEVVIGLETHAELATRTKLWCDCSTEFGAAPNTHTCPICVGMPGVLPVLNRKAFELALRVAFAFKCKVPPRTFFDRKNYYYPDLPKNYQISQNYCNTGTEGHIDIPVNGGSKRVRIHNVHLEEDAGKNIHPERSDADYSLVDLNRAGVPLLEIVTEPDMRGPEEAQAFMETMRRALLYTEVSECHMEQGHLRFEASISLRAPGAAEYGARVEIKNVNSMKAVTSAIEYEIKRQTRILNEGGKVARETRLWDDAAGATGRMRSKEEAQDYRYFPEPDLIPVTIDDEMRARVMAAVPELPLARKRRFIEAFGLPEYDAGVISDDRRTADFFEEALKTYDNPKAVGNWIMNAMLREMKQRGIGIVELKPKPAQVAALAKIASSDRINSPAAQKVFTIMMDTGDDPEEIIRREGLEQTSDSGDILPLVSKAIADNPKAVADFKSGKASAVKFLMGQVMRMARGKANPQVAEKIIQEELGKM